MCLKTLKLPLLPLSMFSSWYTPRRKCRTSWTSHSHGQYIRTTGQGDYLNVPQPPRPRVREQDRHRQVFRVAPCEPQLLQTNSAACSGGSTSKGGRSRRQWQSVAPFGSSSRLPIRNGRYLTPPLLQLEREELSGGPETTDYNGLTTDTEPIISRTNVSIPIGSEIGRAERHSEQYRGTRCIMREAHISNLGSRATGSSRSGERSSSSNREGSSVLAGSSSSRRGVGSSEEYWG